MATVFKEQLIKKKKDKKDDIKKMSIIACTIVLILLALAFSRIEAISMSMVFIIAIVIAVCVYLLTNMNIEYEYAYTDGQLDIDKITNKSKRTVMLEINVSAVECMAHVEDSNYENEFRNVSKTYDFSSGVTNDNTYIAKMTKGEKTINIIFEPDEVVQKDMVRLLTSQRVHLKK